VITVLSLAALALWASVATLELVWRDGYRALPTLRY